MSVGSVPAKRALKALAQVVAHFWHERRGLLYYGFDNGQTCGAGQWVAAVSGAVIARFELLRLRHATGRRHRHAVA